MKREYIDTVTKGRNVCGFCSTSHHDSCKGGYRNGDGSVLICGCECADSKPQFCHHCKSTNPDDLGRPWLCDDRDACQRRLDIRTEWLWREQGFIQAREQLDNLPGSPRRVLGSKRKGECLCCGEPTKGGKFLPGHDSKWLNKKVNELDGPWMPVYEEISQVVSPALAEKFKKRVYG